MDETSTTARYLDAWPRLAWLLITCRLYPRTGEPIGRGDIVAELRSRGVAADLSRVSRWESGQHPPPTRVLLAYEARLGMRAGTLVAVARTLLRATPNSPGPAPAGPSAENEVPAEEVLDQLISRVMDGDDDADSPTLNGGEWLRLAIELGNYQKVFLDPALWSRLSRRLIVEVARTSGCAEMTRLEAGATLLGHPMARRHMLPALDEWLTASDAQWLDPLASLVGVAAEPAATELVFRLMTSPRPVLREEAMHAAAVKLAHGHFGAQSIARLEQYASQRLFRVRSRPSDGLLDLVAHLPRAALSRVVAGAQDASVQRQLRLAAATGSPMSVEVGRGVTRAVSEAARNRIEARGAAEPDPMLNRLVNESLFHVSDARRRLASQILRLSPYHQAVTDHCVELASGPNGSLAARAWGTLEVLSPSPARILSVVLSERRPGLQTAALRALAHCAGPIGEGAGHELATVVARAPDQPTQLAAIDALARCTTKGLSHVVPVSESARDAAAWWRQIGPMLRDSPEARFHRTRTVS